MRKLFFMFFVALTTKGLALPLFGSGSRQHRESTPEILDLEQQLKAQAGEDKQVSSVSTDEVHLPPLEAQDSGIDQAMLDEIKAAQSQGADAIPAQLVPGMSAVANDVLDDDDDDEGTETEVVHNDEETNSQAEDEELMERMYNELRLHPEMVKELLGAAFMQEAEEDSPSEPTFDSPAKDVQGVQVNEAMAWPDNFDPYRDAAGDSGAMEVAKKRGYGPPDEEKEEEEADEFEEQDQETKKRPVLPLVPMGLM